MTMLPEGTYTAKATDIGLAVTKRGTEMVSATFTLAAPPADAPKTIAWQGYLTDAAMPRTVESLRTMGWTGNDLCSLESAMTRDVQIVVEHEEYNGRTYAKVKWVNGVDYRPPIINQEEAKRVASRWKDAIARLAPAELDPNDKVPF